MRDFRKDLKKMSKGDLIRMALKLQRESNVKSIPEPLGL